MKQTVDIFDYSDLPDPDMIREAYLPQNDSLKWVYVERLENEPETMELFNWLDAQGVEGKYEKRVLIDFSW